MLLLAGTAISMCARRLPAMLAGRAVAGLGSGAASVLVPRYLAEIAPVAIRGALGTLTQASGAEGGGGLAWAGPQMAQQRVKSRSGMPGE